MLELASGRPSQRQISGRAAKSTERAKTLGPPPPGWLTGASLKNTRSNVNGPSCEGCHGPWELPREVPFSSGIPQDCRKKRGANTFVPACAEYLVPTQSWDRQTLKPILSEVVYENLSLTYPKKGKCSKKPQHRLVKDFVYNLNDGSCVFDGDVEEGREDEYGHAILLTLNNWYALLLHRLIHIVVDIFSIATTAVLLIRVYEPDGIYKAMDKEGGKREWFRDIMTVVIVVFYLIAVHRAWEAACWEWDFLSSPRVGDLIVKCHKIDRSLTFLRMVVFNFFCVEKMIKDLPVSVHPWKSVQPYGAIKLENTRAHVIGFKSRHLFYVEAHQGQVGVSVIIALNKLIQLVYKVVLMVQIHLLNTDGKILGLVLWSNSTTNATATKESVQGMPASVAVSVLASLVSTSLGLKSLSALMKARTKMKKELMLALNNTGGDESKEFVSRKLLAVHFHQDLIDGKLVHMTRKRNLEKATESFHHQHKCPICGRSCEKRALDASETLRTFTL